VFGSTLPKTIAAFVALVLMLPFSLTLTMLAVIAGAIRAPFGSSRPHAKAAHTG
jgi:hypothetical protein